MFQQFENFSLFKNRQEDKERKKIDQPENLGIKGNTIDKNPNI